MKVQESFTIPRPPSELWDFLEQIDRVAQCVPGVASVEQLDADTSKVRVTQAVGPMTATFDMRMQITERVPGERLAFTATGKAVKGAAGNVRSSNVVRLLAVDGGTRVDLDADLAMGGVLGSVGQKVVSRQVGQVTREFARSLEQAITGEAPTAEGADAGAVAAPDGSGSAPAAAPTSSRSAPAAAAVGTPAPSAPSPGEGSAIAHLTDWRFVAALATLVHAFAALARARRGV